MSIKENEGLGMKKGAMWREKWGKKKMGWLVLIRIWYDLLDIIRFRGYRVPSLLEIKFN